MKRGKAFGGALFGVLLASVLMFAACPGDTDPEQENPGGPYQVSFEPDYENAPSIATITVQGGAASSSRWPADPKRLGYTFGGWFDDTALYTSSTLITKNVTVRAKWSPEVSRLEDQPSPAELAALFTDNLPANLSNSWKIWGHHNALFTQGFGADPTAFEYNNRVYLFASNDSLIYDSNGQVTNGTYGTGIQGLRAVSSADMVNFTACSMSPARCLPIRSFRRAKPLYIRELMQRHHGRLPQHGK